MEIKTKQEAIATIEIIKTILTRVQNCIDDDRITEALDEYDLYLAYPAPVLTYLYEELKKNRLSNGE